MPSMVHRDRLRRDTIRRAVDAADELITGFADGSVEEIDYLTMEVAAAFVEKARLAVQRQLLGGEILRGMDEIQAREEAVEKGGD